MEIKKTFSEKNLKTAVKNEYLLTFQRKGPEPNRLPPKPRCIIQVKKPSINFNKPEPIRHLRKVVSNSKNLPPLTEFNIKKITSLEIDEFGRSLLHSDCQPSRQKDYKESDLINFSCSEEKIVNKKMLGKSISKDLAAKKKVLNSGGATQRGEIIHFATEGDIPSTPTFRNDPKNEKIMNFKGLFENFPIRDFETVLPMHPYNKIPEEIVRNKDYLKRTNYEMLLQCSSNKKNYNSNNPYPTFREHGK